MSEFTNLPEAARLAINRMVAVTEKEKKLLAKALNAIATASNAYADDAVAAGADHTTGTLTPSFEGVTGTTSGTGYWERVGDHVVMYITMVWDGYLSGGDVSIDIGATGLGNFATMTATAGGNSAIMSRSGTVMDHIGVKVAVTDILTPQTSATHNKVTFHKGYDDTDLLQYSDLETTQYIQLTLIGEYLGAV